MADELYDFFGGNAAKKFEPIEDDDIEETDECVDSNQEVETAAVEPTEATTTALDETDAMNQSNDSEKKKAGHWDFLANMLGISSSKNDTNETVQATDGDAGSDPQATPPIETESTKAKVDLDPKRSSPKATVPINSEAEEFLGFEQIGSPEDETVLPHMFSSEPDGNGLESSSANQENADDLIGWAPAPTPQREQKADLVDETVPETRQEDSAPSDFDQRQPERPQAVTNDVGDDDEFVEFEIEELDETSYDESDAIEHGRRPRRRRQPTTQESTDTVDGATHSESRSESGRGQGRDSRSDRSRRTESSRTQRDDSARTQRDDSTRTKRDDSTRTQRDDSTRTKRDDSPRTQRDDSPRTKRDDSTRTKRRDSERQRPRDNAQLDDQHTRNKPPRAESRPAVDDSGFGAGLEEEPVVENSDDRTDKPKKRRRRRRGGKPRSETESPRSEQETGFGSGIIDEAPSQFEEESSEGPRDESSRSEEQDRPSRPRGRARSRDDRSDRESSERTDRGRQPRQRETNVGSDDGHDDGERKRAKVPTWEETISGLIDTNIQNHKKPQSSRRGSGNGNRSRRRR